MRKILPFCLLIFLSGFMGKIPLVSAEAINAVIKQDETFFLQNQLQKANAFIALRELETQNLILEKERMKGELVSVKEERDLLQKKVEGLQRTLLQKEQSFPDQMKKVTDPFQEKIDELTREKGMLQMTIDQKNQRVNEVSGESIALQAEIDNAAREKAALMADLKKAQAELETFKADFNSRVQKERVSLDEKVIDLQSRLMAEKASTGEKIRDVQKPWEDKVLSMSQRFQAQDSAWQKKFAETKVDLEAKIKNLEGLLKQAQEALAAKTSATKAPKEQTQSK